VSTGEGEAPQPDSCAGVPGAGRWPPPAPSDQLFQFTVNTRGRLSEVSELEQIIVARELTADGREATDAAIEATRPSWRTPP